MNIDSDEPLINRPCRVCGGTRFRSAGYQWWPLDTVEKFHYKIAFRDEEEQPGMAAVHLYICQDCGNSILDQRN